MQINIRLSGGLGNQLFQYAFLYSLIRENDWKKEVACVMRHEHAEDHRNFSLHPFNCSIQMNIIDEAESGMNIAAQIFRRKVLFHIYRILFRSEHAAFEELTKHGIYYSRDPYYYPANMKCKRRNVYMEGFFQAFRYFEKYKDEIRQEFMVIV